MACRMRSEAAASMSARLHAVPHKHAQDEQRGALKQSLCLTAATSLCPRLITGHAAVAADMHSSKTICGPVTLCIRFRHHSEFSAEEQGIARI